MAVAVIAVAVMLNRGGHDNRELLQRAAAHLSLSGPTVLRVGRGPPRSRQLWLDALRSAWAQVGTLIAARPSQLSPRVR